MFQPVRAFFQSEPLKNTFLECLHTIYVEGTHTKTLNFESGPASDNNLESGKVAFLQFMIWDSRDSRDSQYPKF